VGQLSNCLELDRESSNSQKAMILMTSCAAAAQADLSGTG